MCSCTNTIVDMLILGLIYPNRHRRLIRTFYRTKNEMSFLTGDQFGQNVSICPHDPNVVGCASGKAFGIAGEGALLVIDFKPNQVDSTSPRLAARSTWPDTLYDVDWSHSAEGVLATGSGDGVLAIWRWDEKSGRLNCEQRSNQEHGLEISSVSWDKLSPYGILTSSWDGTFKIWDVSRGGISCLFTLYGHDDLVYEAVWSCYSEGMVASASGDGTVKSWDVRSNNDKASVALSHGQCIDVLCCDWASEHTIVTGSTDGKGRVWDTRKPSLPVARSENGDEMAIKRIRSLPEQRSLITGSYDCTTRQVHKH